MTSSNLEVSINVADQGVSDHSVSLFAGGFYRDAIRHEAQDLLTELADRSGRTLMDGQVLVQSVLADQAPVMEFNDRRTNRERNAHAALRHLLLGVTTAVRNVYTHDVRAPVSSEEAAVWLALMGRLRDQIEQLTLVDDPPDADASALS